MSAKYLPPLTDQTDIVQTPDTFRSAFSYWCFYTNQGKPTKLKHNPDGTVTLVIAGERALRFVFQEGV